MVELDLHPKKTQYFPIILFKKIFCKNFLLICFLLISNSKCFLALFALFYLLYYNFITIILTKLKNLDICWRVTIGQFSFFSSIYLIIFVLVLRKMIKNFCFNEFITSLIKFQYKSYPQTANDKMRPRLLKMLYCWKMVTQTATILTSSSLKNYPLIIKKGKIANFFFHKTNKGIIYC